MVSISEPSLQCDKSIQALQKNIEGALALQEGIRKVMKKKRKREEKGNDNLLDSFLEYTRSEFECAWEL